MYTYLQNGLNISQTAKKLFIHRKFFFSCLIAEYFS
ncbi:MAG: helix-turn-helix domain-containing protein [Thermoanaerobacteraceae bacterium]|nr:helix-turn-helix domain-containing protein [Thermoanaerobacteraceae bacterium]